MRIRIAQILPHVVLFALGITLVRLEAVAAWLMHLALPAALTVLVLASVLALRFFRPAVLLATTAVALAAIAYHPVAVGLQESGIEVVALRQSVALALAPTLLAFALLPERGLRSASGIVRAAWLPAFAVLAFNLARPPWHESVAALGGPVMEADALERVLATIGLDAIPLLLVLITVGAFAGRWIHRPEALRAAWLSAAVLAGAALSSTIPDSARLWIFTLAGAALLVGLFEHAHALAFRDQLTGLPGRRALMEELQRVGGTWTLAVLDIDHFKKFNDTWGHDLGDVVLQQVAETIRHVGGGGRAFRMGGEEFTIVFRDKDAAQAEPHLEELRRRVGAVEIDTSRQKGAGGKRRSRKKKVRVTASIGGAESRDEVRTAAGLLKLADQALYKAKSAGRNQVVMDRRSGAPRKDSKKKSGRRRRR